MTHRPGSNPFAMELEAQFAGGSDKQPTPAIASQAVRGLPDVDNVLVRPRGRLYSLLPATPAAGTNFSYIHRASQAAIVRAVDMQLDTSATAANRSIAVRVVEGGVVISSSMRDVTIAQIASTTRVWRFRDNWPMGWIEYTTDIAGPLPPMVLTYGAELRTATNNLQTGDQMSGIVLILEDC